MINTKKYYYKSISLPSELIDEINHVNENTNFIYTSVADFIKEAIRIHLLNVKRLLSKKW